MNWLAVVLLLSMLAGCAGGNAVLGPDPGGGFYCPHNAFEGCANSSAANRSLLIPVSAPLPE